MAKQCKTKIVDDALKRFFFKLGFCIGNHPGYFIVIPALLTALCASGFQAMDYEYDPEYLFSPTSGVAKDERTLMEEHFPINYTSFKSSRISRVGKFGRIVVVAKDGGTILRTHVWNQLLYLDQVTRISLRLILLRRSRSRCGGRWRKWVSNCSGAAAAAESVYDWIDQRNAREKKKKRLASEMTK